MSGIDVASNSALLSVAEKLDTQNVFLAAIAGKENGLPINDWGSVQAIVRAGLAPKVFAVGDQLSCNHETYGELVWDIIGIDHDMPIDENFKHSMTLQLHGCLCQKEFDTGEYLFYSDSELLAGTYSFLIPKGYEINCGGSSEKDVLCYFTLTKNVPKGGHIKIKWDYGMQITMASIVSMNSDDVVIETVKVALEGENAVALENAGGIINNIPKSRYGSNSYTNSAIRKWLNSTEEKWWYASDNFDVTPSYVNENGFLKGIDSDFLSILGKANKLCYDATKDDVVTIRDNVFLLSAEEVYGKTRKKSEGKVYDYYKTYSDALAPLDSADSNRIKYFNGVPSIWSLRSPGNTSSYINDFDVLCTIRCIYDDGNTSRTVYGSGSRGIAPACCII